MLTGNGGYSYVLNNNAPVKDGEFYPPTPQNLPAKMMVFQGRTPCAELAKMMQQDKGPACDKMKWYIILYTDSVTGQPSYYLKGGRAYKKETMTKGRWQIIRKNGRTIYKLDTENENAVIYLLRGDDNFLFFTDEEGNLLVGNENFSYTLNRTTDRESQ
ncbi:MAG: hypothetical protein JWN76_1928 [Chitinophagaceae bacterium]|nr:hypothetical protein [Chitinophagaceae bacterium]